MKMTRAIAWAASTDAGNRSAREGGRTTWNEDDYNAACAEFDRLWVEPNNAKYAAIAESRLAAYQLGGKLEAREAAALKRKRR